MDQIFNKVLPINMMKRLLELIRRGWRKPPHVILRWLARQIAAELEQPLARARARDDQGPAVELAGC